MGVPKVTVAFIEQALTAMQRSDRGIIMMLLKESEAEQTDYTIYDISDIPETLTEQNQQQIKYALMGYQTSPKKVLVHLIKADTEYTDALKYIATQKWNYLVVPTVETDKKAQEIASWIKSQRTQQHKTYKAVLPNCAGDQEGVINVTCGYTDGDGKKLTAEQTCARIAGIICGTPLNMSVTYAPLSEAQDCDRLEPTEQDEAVDAGKMILVWDGEKVKICRGVTSFVTTVDGKGDSFKKIKLVEAMDMMQDDIRTTAQDSYIGKYVNSYDNKCLLITAINAYFQQLVREGVLGSGSCQIDMEAQRLYFKGKGGKLVVNGETKNLEDCTDQEIKEGNTGSKVFLKADVSLLDALEDIDLNIYIG